MTLTDYNDRNNTPLSNQKIRETMVKAVEQESILDVNNVTADTFSHTSNTQRQNSNTIFTSEKLDKSDDLEDALQYLTINDAKYYESNTATAIDAQVDLTCNQETVTHTINGNETVTHISNGYFERKLLSNRNIPVVVPTMNPRVDQSIMPILVAPQTLLTPAMKEVVTDLASGGVCVNRNL